MPWRYQIWILKVAMSPLAHAQANENKPEKVNPTFSSFVGDFGRPVFIWDELPENVVKITPQDWQKGHFQLTCIAQKRRCLSSHFYFSVGITNIIRSQDKDGRKTVQSNLHEEVPGPFFGYPSKVHAEVPMTVKEIQRKWSYPHVNHPVSRLSSIRSRVSFLRCKRRWNDAWRALSVYIC